MESLLSTPLVPVFTSRSNDVLPDRRVEFQLFLGNVTGHKIPRATGILCDRWNAQFVFRVVTPVSKRGILDPFHDQARAALRVQMQYALNAFTPDKLPHHQVISLLEHGTEPQVDTMMDADVSEIRFAAVVGIRAEAWALLVDTGAGASE